MTRFPKDCPRLARLLVALVLLVPLAGCAKGPVFLSEAQLKSVGVDLEALERTGPAALDRKVGEYEDSLGKMQDKRDREVTGRLALLIGYAYERGGKFGKATAAYSMARGTAYGYVAAFRMGEIARLESNDERQAEKNYNQAVPAHPAVLGWIRVAEHDGEHSVLANQVGGRLVLRPLQEEARIRLDGIYRKTTSYHFIDWLVHLFGKRPAYSCGLALIFLALAVKIATTPLTNISFRSMRKMQALQPHIKELQAKHGKDREALAREQFALMRKYKINPMGGCLPLLVQMPILIYMYRAIQHYIYPLSKASFLWAPSLAQPDMPLLILYAVSMYLSQKLTAMPSADPQQQQMQKTMTWMMPLLFTTMLSTLPSALILYWLSYNVFFTAHQVWLMRQPLPALQTQPGNEKTIPSGPPPRLRPKRKKR
jgi:YidC/Oxa1 family membrane protein insertase